MSKWISECTLAAIHAAATDLKAGHLVAFPTETVYGLGADACSATAIARIYAVKERPLDHPLIVHISSMQRMSDWALDIPEYAHVLARDFWPGPMTLVLKRSALAKDFITGGQDTVGVRVPEHPVALALLESFENLDGKGVAAPSANRFGHVSPTTAQAVVDELNEYLFFDDQILDGGACAVGVESTIIDCTGGSPRILRPGAVTVEMISESTSFPVGGKFTHTEDNPGGIRINSKAVDGPQVRVSGSLDTHYAPMATVVLDQSPVVGQGFIAMTDVATPDGVVRLAAPKSNEEFARVLYAALRSADEQGLETVSVRQPVGDGIAVAIRDRLERAAKKPGCR